MNTKLTTSNTGIPFIAGFEGLRLVSYKDLHGIWTVGYGHTGVGIVAGLAINQQQALKFLAEDLQTAERAVNSYVKTQLNQNQFDSMVDFTYNCGSGSLYKSDLLKNINAGLPVILKNFTDWDHVNGIPNAGLLRRRTAEFGLYNKPVVL